MPAEVLWEPRGVYRRYFGRVTAEERLRSFEQICADPRFDDIRYTITDFLAVVDYEVSDEATKQMAALHIGPLITNPHILIAAVAQDERVLAAISHFKALGFTGQPYQVFATLAAARRWIGKAGR